MTRRHAGRGLLVPAILVLTAGRPAAAQEVAMDFIRPLMEKDDYAAVVSALEMDRDQRQIVELMYDDYLAGIDAMSERVDRAAIAAGRQKLEEVFAGRVRMQGAELRALRVKVLHTYEACGPGADRLLADFITGLEGILQAPQKAALPSALRELRRRVLLHPRQIGENVFNYAAEGVDVLQLADAASASGAELTGLEPGPLGDVLGTYEQDLDRLLQETASAYRDHALQQRVAALNHDDDAEAMHGRRMLEIWGRQYRLNRDAVAAIGTMLREQKGQWAERLWVERFDRAAFPWMFIPRPPDRQIEWIRDQITDATIRQEAEVKYSMYLAERDTLQREAVDILVAARLDRGVVLHQLTSPRDVEGKAADLYNDMLRNSGAMSNLESRYVAEIEALVDEDQRREMRRAVDARRR